MKKQLLYPPLRDEFTKFGDKFEKIAHNEANGMYCYKRTTPGGLTYYEVFRAPKAKDEDGNIYHHFRVLRNSDSARPFASAEEKSAQPTKSPSIWPTDL